METPSYYSVIPAEVRYDKELKANEKLLYGEIAALTSKSGVCWASNDYFAELYGVDECTVSRWINHLSDKNYISIDNGFKDGSKFRQRVICIDKKINAPCENNQEGIDEKVKHNNTSNNIYPPIIPPRGKAKERKTTFFIPSLEEIQEYIAEKNLNVDARKFYDYFEATNWVDSKGNKVKSWKGKLQTWSSYNQTPVTKTKEELELEAIYERL